MLSENRLFANRYRLIKRLGQGAFSEVWKAEDTKAGNLMVALKVYAPDKGLDEDGAKVFSEEFAIVFNVHHSNLLTPNYFDEENNSPYLVLPFCEQGSALKLVGKMDERQVAQFLHDVSSALAYLHAKDIIHQDIKPDNVLIDGEGNYMVTDFGISTRIRSTLRRSVGDKKSAGTTAYMGPERFSKNPDPIKASDIWSLGATVFELMKGDVPFGEMGGGMQKMGAEVPDIPGNYSPELKQLIERCLASETWNRPTAAQLRDTCDNYLRTGKWDLSPIEGEAKSDKEPHEPSRDDLPSKRPTQCKNTMERVMDTSPQPTKPQKSVSINEDSSKPASKPRKRLPWIIAGAVVLAMAIAVLTHLIVSSYDRKVQFTNNEQAFTDSLYVFPPVIFTDSRYCRVVTSEYDDGSPKVVLYYMWDEYGKPTDNVVHETHYYENQQKYIDGNRKGDNRDGLWYAYFPDGTVQTKGYYEDGKENGRYTVYYSNGNVRYTGLYKYGVKIGEWYYYNEDSTLSKVEKF